MPIENVMQSEGYKYFEKYFASDFEKFIASDMDELLLELIKLAYLEGHIDANNERMKKEQVIDNGKE